MTLYRKWVVVVAVATVSSTSACNKKKSEAQPAAVTTPIADGGGSEGSGSGPAVVSSDVQMAGTIALTGFGLTSTDKYALFVTKLDVDIPDAAKTTTLVAGDDGSFSGPLPVPDTKKTVAVAMVVQLIPATGTPSVMCQVLVQPKDAKAKQPSLVLAAGKKLNLAVTRNEMTGSCDGVISADSDALDYGDDAPELVPVKAGSFAGVWGARDLADKGVSDYYSDDDKKSVDSAVADAGSVEYTEDSNGVDIAPGSKAALTGDAAAAASTALETFDQYYFFTETVEAGNVTKVKQFDFNARRLCYDGAKFAPKFFAGASDTSGADLTKSLGSATNYMTAVYLAVSSEAIGANLVADSAAFDAAVEAEVTLEYARLSAAKSLDGVDPDVAKALVKNSLIENLRQIGYWADSSDDTAAAAAFCPSLVKDYTGDDMHVDAAVDLLCVKLGDGTTGAHSAKVSAFGRSQIDGIERSCNVGQYVDQYFGSEENATATLAVLCNGDQCLDSKGVYQGYLPGFMGEYDVIPGPAGVFSLFSGTSENNTSWSDDGKSTECSIVDEHSRTIFSTDAANAYFVTLNDNGYNNCDVPSKAGEAIDVAEGQPPTDSASGETAALASEPPPAKDPAPAPPKDFGDSSQLFGDGQTDLNENKDGYSYNYKQIWVKLDKANK